MPRDSLGRYTARRRASRSRRVIRVGPTVAVGTEIGGVHTGDTITLGAQPGEAAAVEETKSSTTSSTRKRDG